MSMVYYNENKANKPNQKIWLLEVLTDQIPLESLVFEQFLHTNNLLCPKLKHGQTLKPLFFFQIG